MKCIICRSVYCYQGTEDYTLDEVARYFVTEADEMAAATFRPGMFRWFTP